MILLAEYLDRKGIATESQVKQITELENKLNKRNFNTSAKKVYKIMFDEEPDPSIFTGHKFFKTKIVKEPFTRPDLMKKGLQVFRSVFTRHAEKLRGGGEPEFDAKGIVKFENFLPKEAAASVKQEIEKFPLIENLQPSNNITNVDKDSTPAIYNLIHNSDLFNICVNAVHRKLDDVAAKDHFMKTTYIQRLENRPGDNDIQKVCHSDVFYPCLKYWYFPDEVTADDGPFMFAYNSVELTYEILDFWYEQSVAVVTDNWDQRRNKGHAEGSFRALPEDLEAMGLKLKPVTVKPNTLIIGNTSGFHARGNAIKPTIRSAVHGAIRVETPFDVK